MLGSEKPIAFLATANAAAAIKFYQDQLGLRFVNEDKFAIVFRLRVRPETIGMISMSCDPSRYQPDVCDKEPAFS